MSAKTKSTQVKAIIAFLAKGNSVAVSAKKFKLSPAAINGMVAGRTHSDVTGLTVEGNHGLEFIRNANVAPASKDTAPKATPKIAQTARKATPKTPATPAVIAGDMDLGSNITAIQTEAKTIVSKIDTRMDSLRKEMSDLEAKRSHWESFTSM